MAAAAAMPATPPTPHPAPATPAAPVVVLPPAEQVKAEIDSTKLDVRNKIGMFLGIAAATALIVGVIIAVGALTGGAGVGIAFFAIGIGIGVYAGASFIFPSIDGISRLFVPAELDLLSRFYLNNPPFSARCNHFMTRYNAMDPPSARSALPIRHPGETFPLAEAKLRACASDPAHPPEEDIGTLLKQRKQYAACDRLWDIYSQERNRNNSVELALSIAALTLKTKSRFYRNRYYEENRLAAQQLLLTTYRLVQDNHPPNPMPPQDQASALNALAQMYHLIQ